ncbi:prepilin-type N-terminal cleavage/methylation domain-containing protein [Clostridium transplantifaecale]|uniref:prepilin-type N-terminal cleavage/methylation domain-containing protein n=1 Tax=Clostridium transplantifaecale TaxID=2479838 RepID=UPI000F62EA65|nr:prepilin-type N-terminal cleavage/methylation domain-containing protein [Clostridium transplantifaecale]
MNKKKNNKGFSLIELIIAIAILIILTGLLAPQFMKYIEKSREAKDVQAMDTVYSAVQGALSDETAYNDFIKAHLTVSDSFTTTLTDALNDGQFGKELGDLLGTNTVELNSKKAGGGVVCIVFKYTEGTAAEKDEDGKVTTPATYGGFAITVYCGKADNGHDPITGLETVGTPLSITAP